MRSIFSGNRYGRLWISTYYFVCFTEFSVGWSLWYFHICYKYIFFTIQASMFLGITFGVIICSIVSTLYNATYSKTIEQLVNIVIVSVVLLFNLIKFDNKVLPTWLPTIELVNSSFAIYIAFLRVMKVFNELRELRIEKAANSFKQKKKLNLNEIEHIQISNCIYCSYPPFIIETYNNVTCKSCYDLIHDRRMKHFRSGRVIKIAHYRMFAEKIGVVILKWNARMGAESKHRKKR